MPTSFGKRIARGCGFRGAFGRFASRDPSCGTSPRRTVRFQGSILRHFAAHIRAAVEELTPVEREMARVQRRIETSPARAEGIKESRREQRGYAQRLQQIEERCG